MSANPPPGGTINFSYFPFIDPGDTSGNGGATPSAAIWYDWNTNTPLTIQFAQNLTIASVWIPDLITPVAFYTGATVVGTPFYTTEGIGSELIPIPPGNLQVTISAQAGLLMPIFASSRVFDPTKAGSQTNAVASVGAQAPILSSGGSSPVISMQLPLPISDGGTGTGTPSLVPGTGINITGAWPNQTVSAVSGVGAVTSVTATLPLASSGGTTPNLTIITPLPVSDGGTGTNAPTLVAGNGITLTGAWPGQTISGDITGTGGAAITNVAGAINVDTSVLVKTITSNNSSVGLVRTGQSVDLSVGVVSGTVYGHSLYATTTTGSITFSNPLPGPATTTYNVVCQGVTSFSASSSTGTLTGSGGTWPQSPQGYGNGSGQTTPLAMFGTATGGQTPSVAWSQSAFGANGINIALFAFVAA